MKFYLALMTSLISAGSVFAAESAPTISPPTPTLSLAFTHNEAMVAGMALGNAGAACDAGIQVYCQIEQLRGSITAKLQQALQAPPAKK